MTAPIKCVTPESVRPLMASGIYTRFFSKVGHEYIAVDDHEIALFNSIRDCVNWFAVRCTEVTAA